ncbi:MAG TPA: hypothetical protein VH186_02980 [Chloroflexia bacterium]|nr:hypothetical protein [Chloroflexia bacterium]
MNGAVSNDVTSLLRRGVEEATRGNKLPARFAFQEVLKRDPHNELALMWLAHLANDPYEAVELLERVVSRNPRNEVALSYLKQARAKVAELDQLVSSSSTLSSWSYTGKSKETADKTSAGVPYLGEFLLRQGVITRQQLEMALRRHDDLAHRGHYKRLGEVMIELGYLTETQLERYLQHQTGEFTYRFRD